MIPLQFIYNIVKFSLVIHVGGFVNKGRIFISSTKISERQAKAIFYIIKKKFGTSIAPLNLRKVLAQRKRHLAPFFDVRVEKFDVAGDEKEERKVVHCKNVLEFSKYAAHRRGLNHSECDFIIGADQGKGLMKLTLTINVTNDTEKTNASDKKVLILSVVSANETWESMKKLFELIKLSELSKFRLSMDLKLTNITLGMSSHSSKFPCPYAECYKRNGIWTIGNPRTFSSLLKNAEEFRDVGKGDRKQLQNFYNVENPPCFIPEDRNQEVLVTIPPPVLHLRLGIVNFLVLIIETRHKSEFLRFADSISIAKENYQGRVFQGNEC